MTKVRWSEQCECCQLFLQWIYQI